MTLNSGQVATPLYLFNKARAANVQNIRVMLQNNQDSIVLSKSSSNEDLKRYFTAVMELSKADNKFPINLDEVWPLVYNRRDKAISTLKKNFFEGEDFQIVENESLPQMVERVWGGQNKVNYFLSLSCLEYFIARKVRPVFEVYRQVFHKVAESTHNLPTTYKEALQQLLAQVEKNEQLQQQNAIMLPKVRTYEQVINTPHDEEWLKTTSSVANEIGMSGQKLNKMLCACGIIYRTQSGEYLFTTEYLKWNLGKTVSCVINEEKGQVHTYIKWTTRGRAYIHALNTVNWNKRRAWHLLKEGKEVVAL